MSLTNVTVVAAPEFETEDLLRVKKERSVAEYCWTCTPSVLAHSIINYNLPVCTYLDADLFFLSDPSVLINEMFSNHKTVLITEHRFSFLPRLYELRRGGRFCVQFLTIVNEPEAMKVLDQWRLECIDWCYARYEDGKFGDQKYLEKWPSVYTNIHILDHQGGGLAPWNINRYRFISNGNSIQGKLKKTGEYFDPVFFHFQYVKMMTGNKFDIGWYLIPFEIRRLFYRPYLKNILKTEEELMKLDIGYIITFTKFMKRGFKNKLKSALKLVTGYNIIEID